MIGPNVSSSSTVKILTCFNQHEGYEIRNQYQRWSDKKQ